MGSEGEGAHALPTGALVGGRYRVEARIGRGATADVYAVRDEHLDLRVRHSDLGPVRLREMLYEWAAHDLMHTVQAERAIMQAFLPGTGPWREFFADHDVQSGAHK